MRRADGLERVACQRYESKHAESSPGPSNAWILTVNLGNFQKHGASKVMIHLSREVLFGARAGANACAVLASIQEHDQGHLQSAYLGSMRGLGLGLGFRVPIST